MGATTIMRCLLLTLLLALTALPAFADHEFYVAPNGNDAWSGALAAPNADATDGPWQSLEGARDAVRRLRADGKLERRVIINLREGTYARYGAPLQLGPEDSGKPGAPVLWRAMPGERATISGGVPIATWEVRDGVWVANIREIANPETGAPGALWINGERRILARTPNAGEFFLAKGKADPALKVDATTSRTYANHAFEFTEGNLVPSDDLSEALVTVFHAWEVSYHRITDLNVDKRTVQFVNDAYWPFSQWEPEQRYYVENLRSALDQPGEWCVNRKEGLLYYLPLPGETPESVAAIIPVTRQFLSVQGDPAAGKFAEFIQFENLAFQHSDWPVGAKGHSDPQAANSVRAVIELKFAQHCALTRCEISHTGGYGLWLDAGCQQNRISGNHLHELGAGGIRVGGSTEPVGTMSQEQVVASRNLIENNWIHDGGKIYQGGVGVWIGHANYITVAHNEISDFFYTGISNGWVWGYGDNPSHHNIIEYNHIHDIGKRLLSDMGGIYNLGIQPGTVLRNNLIHDIRSHQYGGWGLYTDEGSTEMLLENNVVYNTTSGGFHQHYGRNNRIRNNIFAFSDSEHLIASRIEEHRSFVFERNIVITGNGKVTSANWPKADIWSDYNLFWDLNGTPLDFSGTTLGAVMATGRELNSIYADPKCADPNNYNFTLAPDSPAITQLGFQPIDLSRVGLTGDTGWKNAPDGK